MPDARDAAAAPAGEQPELAAAIADILDAPPPIEIERAGDYGRFDGLPAQTEWDQNGRSSRLLRALTYHSAEGVEWPVPEGSWFDGASIPKVFWSIIGGPYEGRYREASIVHDHFCIKRIRAWRDTHRMFYDAMLCRGVSGFKARLMYYAVYRFGPRWAVAALVEAAGMPRLDAPGDAAAPSLRHDAALLRTRVTTLDGIEALAEAAARDRA